MLVILGTTDDMLNLKAIFILKTFRRIRSLVTLVGACTLDVLTYKHDLRVLYMINLCLICLHLIINIGYFRESKMHCNMQKLKTMHIARQHVTL